MNDKKVKCPNCEKQLRLMGSYYINDYLISELYHCEECDSDWELERTKGNKKKPKLKRYFFG